MPMGGGSLTICLRASISLWEIVSREQEIVLSEPRSLNVHSHLIRNLGLLAGGTGLRKGPEFFTSPPHLSSQSP